MKKGEITVFLSLLFILLISFTAGILEASVVQTAKNIGRLKADRAIFSVFGEYQRTLLEKYHVFALEGSYGTGDYAEENILKRMHYYGTEEMEHSISAIQYLTDNRGQSFREQVMEYMEQRYGIKLIKNFTGMTAEWEEQSIQGENMEETEASILEKYRELTGGDNTENLPDNQNPFSYLGIIGTSGILSLTVPDGMDLSEKQIRLENQASYRKLRTGYGSFPARKNSDGIEEKLLFNEYILQNFQNAALPSEESYTEKPDEDENKNMSLDYEVEYLLSGKKSDKENLESVIFKIFLIRMALNYIYLQSDTSRKAQAGALAVIIAGLLLMPEIAEPLKQLLILAWAAGESIVDIRTLLSGKRVPLTKNTKNWQLPLYSLLLLGTGADTVQGRDSQDGISYEEYLRAFLFLENKDNITMRTLDRVEENLRTVHGLDFFQADQCISKLEVDTKVPIAGEISYRFPVYFGYE